MVQCSAMSTIETKTRVLVGNSFPFSLVRCEWMVVEGVPAERDAAGDFCEISVPQAHAQA